jgi:hypothetical protein
MKHLLTKKNISFAYDFSRITDDIAGSSSSSISLGISYLNIFPIILKDVQCNGTPQKERLSQSIMPYRNFEKMG